MTLEEKIARYQAMVDRWFLGELSTAECAEMEALGRQIDAHFEPFYRPIIERLEAARMGSR